MDVLDVCNFDMLFTQTNIHEYDGRKKRKFFKRVRALSVFQSIATLHSFLSWIVYLTGLLPDPSHGLNMTTLLI